MKLKVVLEKDAIMPTKANSLDAGFDLYSMSDTLVCGRSSETQGCYACFDTGVHIEIPQGYVGFLKSKSGLNVNHNLTSEGVIDAGYTGSIMVKLYNHGEESYLVEKGDKISQLVILPIPQIELEQVETLGESERGDKGFGSSGR